MGNKYKAGDRLVLTKQTKKLIVGDTYVVERTASPSGYEKQIPWVLIEGKRNHISYDGSFREELFEPAPLFAVGDKVRLVEDNSGFGKKGELATVVLPDDGDRDCLVKFDKHQSIAGDWFVKWANLEHATTVEEAKSKFKVGDRVTDVPSGDVGTVVEIKDDKLRIHWRGHSSPGSSFWPASDFHLGVPALKLVWDSPSTTGFTIPTDEEALPPKARGTSHVSWDQVNQKLIIEPARISTITAGILRTGNTVFDMINGTIFRAPVIKTAKRPAIVALIANGKPLPATVPKVHKTTTKATKEANRLATRYPGQEFGVFELVSKRVAEVTLREAA